MKSAFVAAMVATAAHCFTLTDWSKAKNETFLDGKIAVNLSTATEWYWGLRSPVQWAKWEDYHEAWSWAEEVYTKWTWSFEGGARFIQDGETMFGLQLTPWIRFFDITFFENLFYVWPHEFEGMEAWSHCNYMGWWFKFAQGFIDLQVTDRECKVGVHAYLADSVDPDCFSATYSVDKVKMYKLKPFYKKEEGMYGWGMNSCEDTAFSRHKLEERSFLDAFKSAASDVQDAAGEGEVDFDDDDYYYGYY